MIYNVHVLNNINDPLNEREFELINIIGAQLAGNQRDLSRRINLSLGMTNLLIARLAAKGYIRIKQLNKRKMQYLLTPKGFTEKMRKSLKYTLKTIHSIQLLNDQVETCLRRLYAGGQRVFYVLGDSGLTPLVEAVLKEKLADGCVVKRIARPDEQCRDGLILVCQEKMADQSYMQYRNLNLIEELAKTPQDHFIQDEK